MMQTCLIEDVQNGTSKEVSVSAPRRWPAALAGAMILMMLGAVYAWSVFKNPLIQKHHWSAIQVGMTFTLNISCLALAAALGGRWIETVGAKRMLSLSAVLYGGGFLIAGAADALGNLSLLWLGYGILAGLGDGLGYITTITVLVRCFPASKGVVTGFAIMGFGLGAAMMGQIAPIMIIKVGIAPTFWLAGIIFLIVLAVAVRSLVRQDAKPHPIPRGGRADAVSVEYKDALTMVQFYVLWLAFFFNITAGLLLISNLSPLAQQLLAISPVQAGSIVLMSSICNGLGRFFWAWVAERVGCNLAFQLILMTQVPVFLALGHLTQYAVFTLCCCYIMFCYGGGFGVMPSFTADTFGPRCFSSIYGSILLAWGAAAVAGPILLEVINAGSKNTALALMLAAAALGVGLGITFFYRKSTGSYPVDTALQQQS